MMRCMAHSDGESVGRTSATCANGGASGVIRSMRTYISSCAMPYSVRLLPYLMQLTERGLLMGIVRVAGGKPRAHDELHLVENHERKNK